MGSFDNGEAVGPYARLAECKAEIQRLQSLIAEIQNAGQEVVDYTKGNSDYARREEFRRVENQLIDNLEAALHRIEGK